MAEADGKREIVRAEPQTPDAPLTVLRLGANDQIDLGALSPAAAEEIRKQHAMKAVERDHEREKLRQDLAATNTKLDMYTKTAVDTSAENAAVTITNVNEDSLGRTEMIIGNTDAARKGKLTRSQTGFGDNATTLWVVLGIVGIIVCLLALLRR